MDTNNPYIILNVPYNASINAIKSAYKKLALVHHPDVSTGDAITFLRIKNAYEILIDSEKRKKLDIELLNSNHFINLQNNTLDYVQLLTLLNKLELEIQNCSYSNINKELLGEYLLWLFDKNRIYHFILSGTDKEINFILSKTLGLLKYTSNIHQLEFYQHILNLQAHFKIILIKEQTILDYIYHVRRKITYNKYKLIILLFASIFLCFIIFFASK